MAVRWIEKGKYIVVAYRELSGDDGFVIFKINFYPTPYIPHILI